MVTGTKTAKRPAAAKHKRKAPKPKKRAPRGKKRFDAEGGIERRPNGTFDAGNRGGPGRAGSPNVVSAELRTQIMASLQTKSDMTDGGDEEVLRYLVKDLKFSKETPLRMAYAGLVKQMAPKNISVKVEKTLADYVMESWHSGQSN